jgi:hypothetical protein
MDLPFGDKKSDRREERETRRIHFLRVEQLDVPGLQLCHDFVLAPNAQKEIHLQLTFKNKRN